MNGEVIAAQKERLTELKSLLLEATPNTLENVAAVAIGKLIGVPVVVAQSGFQYGADAGPCGRQGRTLRIECKRYGDETKLDERELRGEIDQAIDRDPSIEGWILVTTRSVPEQIIHSLSLHGERNGLPVLVIDWNSVGNPLLAALLTAAHPEVTALLGAPAKELLSALEEPLSETLQQIRKDIATWQLGFETIRRKAESHLQAIWNDARRAQAAFAQNVAGGAELRKIRRKSVFIELDQWWASSAGRDSPSLLVGYEGMGKTWVAMDWLVANREKLPIVIPIPSSAFRATLPGSVAAIESVFANQLLEITRVKDEKHWLLRIQRLLRRPDDSGPSFVVLLDGLNQEPSVPWAQILAVLQSPPFSNRVKTIVTTRPHYFESSLRHLRCLVDPAQRINVPQYGNEPNGELDQMLALHGLDREDLDTDVAEMARTPRLFDLVVRYRNELRGGVEATVHRLLWAYGKDSRTHRSNRSFTEDEWRQWLSDVAKRHLDGIAAYTTSELSSSASAPHLSASDVYLRLSDIIDGRFVERKNGASFQVRPEIVIHALATDIVEQLDEVRGDSYDELENLLTTWLDPVSGLDQKAEILAAATSIVVEQGRCDSKAASVLVTAWLQTQNISDTHRRELISLCDRIYVPLLDTIERSQAHSQTSAQHWAATALKAVDARNETARKAIIRRITDWFRVVSRDVDSRSPKESGYEQLRSKKLIEKIGRDEDGAIKVLGVDLQLTESVRTDSTTIGVSLLTKGPLADGAELFVVAAVAKAVSRTHAGWDALKWLCLMNEEDNQETAEVIRMLATRVGQEKRESYVHHDVQIQVSKLLLTLTGHETDEVRSGALKAPLYSQYDYQLDYLEDPVNSIFALERQHVHSVFYDSRMHALRKLQRARQWIADPYLSIPSHFSDEAVSYVKQLDVKELHSRSARSVEDYSFDEMQVLLSRCRPDVLVELNRNMLRSFSDRTVSSRYWSALAISDRMLLLDDSGVREAFHTLRRLGPSTEHVSDEWYTVSLYLIGELINKPGYEQVRTILSSGCDRVLLSLYDIVNPISLADAENLVSTFAETDDSLINNLISLLAKLSDPPSGKLLDWIRPYLTDRDGTRRGLAFATLAQWDVRLLGKHLIDSDWSWTPLGHLLENEYGSEALVELAGTRPFEELAYAIAPWWLVKAALKHGGKAADLSLAAEILNEIVLDSQHDLPEQSAFVSVDSVDQEAGPYRLSVEPSPQDLESSFGDSKAMTEAYNRVARLVSEKVRNARESGAKLYLTAVAEKDILKVLEVAPRMIDDWIAGYENLTADFKRKVRQAEGVYLSLCRILMERDIEVGIPLWRSIASTLTTRFIGPEGVNEMLGIAFAAKDSPESRQFWESLLDKNIPLTDELLLEVSIAAVSAGRGAWLREMIDRDLRSDVPWRRRRAMVLNGFLGKPGLPFETSWVEGQEPTGSLDVLHRRSEMYRFRHACACHWWHAFVKSTDVEAAYACWILLLSTADRRIWLEINRDTPVLKGSGDLGAIKFHHLNVNISTLERAIKKNEERLDSKFLGRSVDGYIDLFLREQSARAH